MAIDNDSDKAVATLLSIDGLHRLRMKLSPLPGPSHAGWHGYSLRLERIDTGDHLLLQSTDDAPLFLDWAYDPEVSNLCDGIWSVVEGGDSYSFEPVDEKDFLFSVQRQMDHFSVKVIVQNSTDFKRLGWSEGVPVDGAALIQFTRELKEQLHKVSSNMG